MKFFWILFSIPHLLIFSSCVEGQNNLILDSVEGNKEEDFFPINERLEAKAKSLQSYLKKNISYNQHTVVLIDMRQNSGKFRLFVYDLDSMKILSKGLVAHGSGSETGKIDSLRFSNVPNSYCSSLGKYKIGASYIGSFGKSYKLHGLDETNDKAYERFVVLHRYSCVPNEEQEYQICNSLGCPMVSENYFLELDKFICNSKKPLLMEIFY